MKNKKKMYKIYRFCFNNLFTYGSINEETKVLEVSEIGSKMSLIGTKDGMDKKGDCQLFDQTCKAFNLDKNNEDNFKTFFINIDFSNFIKNGGKLSNVLKRMPNGISLYIENKQYVFLTFLKSNSMSKNCCVYYINSEVKDYIEPRITLNLDKYNMVLSKWYAYSGLSISDAIILENIKLTEDEIVIIPDKEVTTEVECITAISVPFLVDKIKELNKYIIDILYISNDKDFYYEVYYNFNEESNKQIYSYLHKISIILKEIKAYVNSKDYENLFVESKNVKVNFNKMHIAKILNVLKDLDKCSIKSMSTILNNLIEDYAVFDILEKKYCVENNINHVSNSIYWEKFHVFNYPVVVNKFDGEGLCDIEFARLINKELQDKDIEFNDDEYEDIDSYIINQDDNMANDFINGYSFQIRLPFIKGIVHSCDFKRFFKEKNISQIYGLTYDGNKKKLYNIESIKMILTESQFKAKSFMKSLSNNVHKSPLSCYFDLLKEYDYCLAISNLEPSNKNKVKLNYQFISTIPFANRELDKLIEENKIIYKNKMSKSAIAKDLCEFYKNDKDILDVDKSFYYSTKRFKYKESIINKNIIRDLLSIKLNAKGYRKILCSDLLELLYHSAYYNSESNYNCEYLNNYEFYAPNTKIETDNDEYDNCFLLRNPHYSRNEIAVLKPAKVEENSERNIYFGHLTGVVMVNALSLTADRLGGADYDGDTIIILNNKYRSKTIKKLFTFDKEKNVLKMKYPLIKIPSIQTTKQEKSFNNIAQSFENTFSSRVGLISYNAFQQSFESYNNTDDDQIMPYFTILSGLEIDSAKNGVKPLLIKYERNNNAKFFLDFNNALKSDKVNLKKYKDKVIELENEHNLFKICSKVYQYELDKKADRKIIKINKNNINREEVLKSIAIYLVYDEIKRLQNKNKKYKYYSHNKNISINNAFTNICSILIENNINIDINDFIEKFVTDNPFETLKKYCCAMEKYHFMFTVEERKDFIINELNICGLPEEILDIVTNFENDGVYLLYMILYFLKENFEMDNNKKIILEDKKYTKQEIEKQLLCLSSKVNIKDDELSIINDYYSFLLNRINKVNKSNKSNSKEEYLNNLDYNMIKILRKEANFINADSCISIFKSINKTDIILDVFNRQLLEVLNRKEVNVNG